MGVRVQDTKSIYPLQYRVVESIFAFRCGDLLWLLVGRAGGD
jgi:hypothetical protein